MKTLCPKCLTTHWEDQVCKVKSLLELPSIFPSPPADFVAKHIEIHQVDLSAGGSNLVEFTAPLTYYPQDELAAQPVKPKKVLSKAHLAALKAGREAKAKEKRK